MRYSLEEFEQYDKVKSKVLKYVLYKKRTEQEVRQKFSKEIDDDILDEIIQDLKENAYIDDYSYTDRLVNESIRLKNMSMKELKYKLFSKGIKNEIIDDYFTDNIEKLEEYEKQSASRIADKKKETLEDQELRAYLLRKGYKEDNI